MRSFVVAVCAASLFCTDTPAAAQNATGTLQITVVDATGAVIVGATVTVAGIDDGTKAGAPPPAQTSDKGIATIPRLVPGRYSVQASFPGFETRAI